MMGLKGFKFIRFWVNLRKEFQNSFCIAFQENKKLNFFSTGHGSCQDRKKDGVIMRDLIFMCFFCVFLIFYSEHILKINLIEV